MSFGQGGPYGPGGGYGPGGSQPPTPDWAALADDSARRGRRRKLLFIGGGVLATAAIGAIVATAVISSGDKGKSSHKSDKSASQLPSPQDLPSESPTPEPTFSDVAPPAPPKPLDIISSAKRDTAPISTGTLFPKKAVGNGHEYTKAATAATKSCATAAQGGLASVLTNNGCRQLFRATYSKDGVAVTVGIAVFDTKAAAERAKQQAAPNVASLSGGGVPVFCRQADCQASTNAIGRYAYFTIAGYTSGADVTTGDTKAVGAGRDIADYAFRRILERGNQQASAAATATG
ncbi:hypothetical protein [Streptomyces sp. ME19-01-6]|uniref:hypothetical protein n=1 Tax=Streptomyces sp. ME19-01-6 TaxID=3028686 RepID=UPI0029A21EAD|nr:hypothetical protein [Streptomyces sp. ME19-01-6]MDX3226451.1 hypothetical protein [Streptomyces sp. ME19-01-6]